jgi:hypothetical protein
MPELLLGQPLGKDLTRRIQSTRRDAAPLVPSALGNER